MKKTILIPAKINLTLDVLGVENGFHKIKSLVASINLFDAISLYKRNDHKITLSSSGILCDCDTENNNAYKTAKLYMETYKTLGVDIYINKSIPIGNGLGGSSADIAGVLLLLNKMFNAGNVYDLAKKLGSDVTYMLKGGYAVISGKGDIISPLNINKTLYLNIIPDSYIISAKDSYKSFDCQNKIYNECTDLAVKYLNDGKVYNGLKNDLYFGSIKILPILKNKIDVLQHSGAIALMTGSGSAVYGIYKNEKNRNEAFDEITKLYPNTIKANTIKGVEAII